MKLLYLPLISLLILSSCNKSTQDTCGNLTISTAQVACDAPTFNSSLNGFQVINYPGTSNKQYEGNLVNGIPDGFWKVYFTNGDISMEGNYTNGQLDGFWKVYYTNGNIREEGNYLNCERSGFWKYYHSQTNNAVQYEGDYQNGSPNGSWKEYTIQGEQIKEYSCP